MKYLKTTFRLLIILLLFILVNNIILNAQWEACNNGLGGNHVLCFIIDGKNTYVGIDGGIFMTSDNGDHWIAKNNGLKNTKGLGIGSFAIYGKNFYAGSGFDGIFLSTDKGENWSSKNKGLPQSNLFYESVNSIAISGNNIFAGTDKGVYISRDNGGNWTSKNNGLYKSDTLNIWINSFAISENNIFAGTELGVFFTSDNGDNWIKKNKGLTTSDTVVYPIAIIGNNIFAGTRRGIYLSTDNGDNWHFSGLKDTLVDTFIIKGNNIFAGTVSIFLSTDNGYNWNERNNGLPYTVVNTMIINGDYIFAGTNNSGIFRAKLSDFGITDVKETNQKNENVIYPNPASSEFNLKFESKGYSKTQISIIGMLGNEVFITYEDCSQGSNEKTIDCRSLATGYYVVKVQSGERVQTHPLMILK